MNDNIIFQIKYKNIDNVEDIPIIFNIMKNIIIKENEKIKGNFNYISHFIEQNELILFNKITWNVVSTIYSVEKVDSPIIKEYTHSNLLKNFINEQLENLFINDFFSKESKNFFEKGIVKKVIEEPINQNIIGQSMGQQIDEQIDQNLIGQQINNQINQQKMFINEITKKSSNEKKEIFFNQNPTIDSEWKKIERKKRR